MPGERAAGERLALRPANASASDGVRELDTARPENGVDGIRRSNGRGDVAIVDDARWKGETERRPSNGEPRAGVARFGDGTLGLTNTSRAGDGRGAGATGGPFAPLSLIHI